MTVYLKYKNIKKVFENTNDILRELNLTDLDILNINEMCKFNKKLLTVHGYIDVHIDLVDKIPKCIMKVNYSYVIELMIIAILLSFSTFFIIILYNAFLITIDERKKEYAILNSIGGTEGQVLKMVFTEAILMGIVGIIVGGIFSTFFTNFILHNINNILNRAGYYFKLVFDIKYIILSIVIIAINIYFAVLIPSAKASSASVIQGIRNNKKMKARKRNTILERILPIEGKVAIKNIKRNKSKYRHITFLIVICITTFISISTYIEYEKATSDIITEYNVDAEINFYSDDMPDYVSKYLPPLESIDYKSILKNYETKYGKNIEYIEYRQRDNDYFVIKPIEAILNDKAITNMYGIEKIKFKLIALDDKTYSKYIKQINANIGDIIIYNSVLNAGIKDIINENYYSYSYSQVLNPNFNIKVSGINEKIILGGEYDYEIIETPFQNKNCVITEELIDGFKEIKTQITAGHPTLFIDMNTYKQFMFAINEYHYKNDMITGEDDDVVYVKIKCEDVVELKNYLEEKLSYNVARKYYTLENQEKIIYIDIIELILKVIMIAIVTIGIVSTINIINASLIERKEDFNILYRMGASKGNVKKILIYESIYMFVKAVIIAIILSIPIVYKIIKQMENILVLNKLLVPFGSIGIFIAMIFVISLMITIYSTKMIKEE